MSLNLEKPMEIPSEVSAVLKLTNSKRVQVAPFRRDSRPKGVSIEVHGAGAFAAFEEQGLEIAAGETIQWTIQLHEQESAEVLNGTRQLVAVLESEEVTDFFGQATVRIQTQT